MSWWTLRQLRSNETAKRVRAVHSLGASGKPQAFDYLVTALADPDFEVRKAAAQALGSFEDLRAVEPLLGKIEDSSASVREAVIHSLGRLRDARALELLLASLKDEDPGVRTAAVQALERSWASESKQALGDYRGREAEARHDAEQAAKRLAEEATAKRLAERAEAKPVANKGPENPVEKVIQMISSLGPDALSAYCSYTSHERAQSAANHIVDNDAEFVSLARSKKAVIAVVKMADGAAVIFGGLLSVGHMTRLYQSVLKTVRPDQSVLTLPTEER